MQRHSRHWSAVLFLSLALGGCGGGGGAGTDTQNGSSGSQGATTTTTLVPVSSTTSTPGTTTTTLPAGSSTTLSAGTTTSSVGTTTSTAAGTTSTTKTAATTTTTQTGTSTTLAKPPLAGTKTILDAGKDAILGTVFWAEGDSGSGGHGANIGNANCVSYDLTNVWPLPYYAHFHLSIFRNGERLAIPRYIGYASACLYELNSDNMNGVVDMFSTTLTYKRLTLGDFFGVWGYPLAWDNIANITGLPVAIYIEDGGVLQQYSGNPADIELLSQRSITIQIGVPLSVIPVYGWQNYGGGE